MKGLETKDTFFMDREMGIYHHISNIYVHISFFQLYAYGCTTSHTHTHICKCIYIQTIVWKNQLEMLPLTESTSKMLVSPYNRGNKLCNNP